MFPKNSDIYDNISPYQIFGNFMKPNFGLRNKGE